MTQLPFGSRRSGIAAGAAASQKSTQENRVLGADAELPADQDVDVMSLEV
jgi:hypothetical protein